MNVVHRGTTFKAITSGECLACYHIRKKLSFLLKPMSYWLSKVNYCGVPLC